MVNKNVLFVSLAVLLLIIGATAVFTVSAGLAGVAGALFVPQVGIISPSLMGIVPSVEVAIWVAVGGRGVLMGAVLGAIVVNGAKSLLSESFPDIWQYFLGALFVGAVLIFPNGIMGLFRAGGWRPRWPRLKSGLGQVRTAVLKR
jgi:urea transport system permease protein